MVRDFPGTAFLQARVSRGGKKTIAAVTQVTFTAVNDSFTMGNCI